MEDPVEVGAHPGRPGRAGRLRALGATVRTPPRTPVRLRLFRFQSYTLGAILGAASTSPASPRSSSSSPCSCRWASATARSSPAWPSPRSPSGSAAAAVTRRPRRQPLRPAAGRHRPARRGRRAGRHGDRTAPLAGRPRAGWATAGPLLVAGIGSGLVIAPNQTITLSEVPVERAAAARACCRPGSGSAPPPASPPSARCSSPRWPTAAATGPTPSNSPSCSPPASSRSRWLPR